MIENENDTIEQRVLKADRSKMPPDVKAAFDTLLVDLPERERLREEACDMEDSCWRRVWKIHVWMNGGKV